MGSYHFTTVLIIVCLLLIFRFGPNSFLLTSQVLKKPGRGRLFIWERSNRRRQHNSSYDSSHHSSALELGSNVKLPSAKKTYAATATRVSRVRALAQKFSGRGTPWHLTDGDATRSVAARSVAARSVAARSVGPRWRSLRE